MKRPNLLSVVLFGIIGLLVIALVWSLTANHETRDPKAFVLSHFDKVDVMRLNEMVHRHQEGKGDYLILIPPIIDGGYWIHDVHSDGKVITWTVDNTRDAYSSERGKKTYTCKQISVNETAQNYVYTLSQCDGVQETSLPILRISKEQ